MTRISEDVDLNRTRDQIAATLEQVAQYLAAYAAAYRQEYRSFVSPGPDGGGYPPLPVSPYLYSTRLTCFVAHDGYAIADFSREPKYQWELAGGPGLVTDFPESKTPPQLIALLKEQGIFGQHIGLYRLVAEAGIPDDVWRGSLGRSTGVLDFHDGNLSIRVEQYDLTWDALVQRLTFGAFGLILDTKLPKRGSPFWRPQIVRDLGFLPADRNSKRFFHYLELGPHLDSAAWDPRSIPTRVAVDIRRDFAYAFASQQQAGGSISVGAPNLWVEQFRDRLRLLGNTISAFASLLAAEPSATEDVFHAFLDANPVLLDVYGEIHSKPQFRYPRGESPLGKEYVEPDFLIRYPNDSYKLIELERPSKALGTARGEARAGVTQAAFQIAEWRTYIAKFYDQIKFQYPGIALDLRTMLVIGRSTEHSVGRGRKVREYLELLRNQLKVDEIYTYDDLLERARSAYARLAALTPAAG